MNFLLIQEKCLATQLFSSLVKRSNVSWAANQHIRMIFERSLDIKDWSNDAENSALMKITIILKYTKKLTIILDCNNIWQFLWCFWSNKCSLASFRNITILQPQTCEQWCVFFSEQWIIFELFGHSFTVFGWVLNSCFYRKERTLYSLPIGSKRPLL